MKINLLRPCMIGVSVCFGIVAFAPVAGAAPKMKMQGSRLEIWPGQRVLVVLPLIVSDEFMSATNDTAPPAPNDMAAPPASDADDTSGALPSPVSPAPGSMPPATMESGGSSALANALKPLLSPQLSAALQATGKFSVIRPYKFDPLLTRAVNESAGQGLTQDAANNFVTEPSLDNAQAFLGQVGLEQPGMVARVFIQSLKVGGTPEMPTVQLSMRGALYEASYPTPTTSPFRSINVTSRPFTGKTPEDRLVAAANQAFSDIAAAFVAPPAEFQLPLPPAAAPGMMTGATPGGGGTMTPSTGTKPMTPGGGATPSMPMPTPSVPVAPVIPQTPNGTTGTPLVPQLPGSTPPLGVNVPDQN